MRFTFQQRPYDLILILLLSAVVAPLDIFGIVGIFRIVLGLVLVLFTPGYVLAAALFPGAGNIDWFERLALSVGLSISVTALLGLALNFTAWGIRLEPILASLLVFSFGTGALAYWRRLQLLPSKRLSLSLEIALPKLSSFTAAEKFAGASLAAFLVFAAGTVVYVALDPRPAEHFTEFYILNATGVAGGYPSNLTANQTGAVNLTVRNMEDAAVGYAIKVTLANLTTFFNASANRTEYRVISLTFVTNFTFQLPNGGYWNQTYTFKIPSPGLYRLYFDLYKLPDTQRVYHYLFLTVRVHA